MGVRFARTSVINKLECFSQWICAQTVLSPTTATSSRQRCLRQK
jgi:hypothetical protein